MTNTQLLTLAKSVSSMMAASKQTSDIATELLFTSPKKSLEIGQHILQIQGALDSLGQIVKREYADLQANEGQGALAE